VKSRLETGPIFLEYGFERTYSKNERKENVMGGGER
jgi:hypothetical protein